MKIIVDCLGGDNAPEAIIDGVIECARKRSDINFILVGPEKLLKDKVLSSKLSSKRFEIVDAQFNVTNDDIPISVIKDKKESSLGKCLEKIKEDDSIDGLFTCASTGATLTGSIFKIGRLENVFRPALVATLPTRKNKFVRILDAGANVDCKSEYLHQFAIMGSDLAKAYGIDKPKIGLLSVGMEDEKGNSLTHEVFQMLKNDKELNFIGNIEGDRILDGDCDIVVCDGFDGNVLVKGIEGSCYFVSDAFTKAIKKNLITKFGALFQLKELKKVKKIFAVANEACSPLLGIKKLVVKAHGKSKANNVSACLLQEADLVDRNLINVMNESLSRNLSIEKKEN